MEYNICPDCKELLNAAYPNHTFVTISPWDMQKTKGTCDTCRKKTFVEKIELKPRGA